MPIGLSGGLREPFPAVRRSTSKQNRVSVIRYQSHIDGLRAVAVLFVILHHVGDWAGMRGGYVGVDVFFVISGFLITSIVRRELEAGSFTFGGFYKRRVIRLAPAYFTVLLATTVAAMIWLLPAELLAYVRSMAASSLFLANFHAWKEIGGYFGADAHTAPLLHLWSLAVEEQFYLFWPAALLLAYRLLGTRWMLWMVTAVAIGGLLGSQWGVERYPAAAYYLLPTRAFELAVGALLAYLPAATADKRVSVPASLVGAGLILFAAMAYGRETLFPGYHAIAPVLGTALLLRWGAQGPVGRLLSTPLATGIGKLSYPAYLWHWPIIVFLHVNEVPMSVAVGMAILLATFMLSWLTYRGLELPARRFLTSQSWKVVAGGAGLPIATSVAVAFGVVALQGIPARFPESLNRKSDALAAFPSKLRGRCNEGPPTKPLPPEDCILGRPDGKVDFLLVGDSHANHFSGFMDELGKDANLRGYDMTRSNTPFLPKVDLAIPKEPGYNRNFRPRNDYVSEHLFQVKYDAVVLAGAYSNFFEGNILHYQGRVGPEAFAAGMREALREANASSRRVLVFTQVPSLAENLHDCSLRAERHDRSLECRHSALLHRQHIEGVRTLYEQLASEFPRIEWIDLDKLLCDSNWCVTEMDDIPLYKDSGHLNDAGSRLLARKWLARFGNPLVGDAISNTPAKH